MLLLAAAARRFFLSLMRQQVGRGPNSGQQTGPSPTLMLVLVLVSYCTLPLRRKGSVRVLLVSYAGYPFGYSVFGYLQYRTVPLYLPHTDYGVPAKE